MVEILKIINDKIVCLQDTLNEVEDSRMVWIKKHNELLTEVKNLKQEKEVLMNEVNNLKGIC